MKRSCGYHLAHNLVQLMYVPHSYLRGMDGEVGGILLQCGCAEFLDKNWPQANSHKSQKQMFIYILMVAANTVRHVFFFSIHGLEAVLGKLDGMSGCYLVGLKGIEHRPR